MWCACGEFLISLAFRSTVVAETYKKRRGELASWFAVGEEEEEEEEGELGLGLGLCLLRWWRCCA